MKDVSWYVLEATFGAPNDAASEYHVVSTPAELRAAVDALDPHQLLASCVAVWVFQRGRAERVLDVRPFIHVRADDVELRADDEEGLDALWAGMSGASDEPEVTLKWEELEAALPALRVPLLPAAATGEVTGAGRMAALAREQGLASSLTQYEEFARVP